ncbi:hypothetical protein E8E14_013135 [Neopestalotiopsis sp. 37M]|jgi:nitrogen fixation-related uncharacterized protein|nr:hypothetical protein E8E14_013135 [Neopestalotiopsis sp. 37M]
MAPLLPTLAAGARTLLTRAISSTATGEKLDERAPINHLGPLQARSVLLARDDASSTDVDPSRGVIDPHNINNNAMFALFALIGVAFVVVGIWFFFWAKNGGFYFQENDWDDYKSTVLRRTGPNGTILSNATKSTKLGGGSIYKDVDDGMTEYTGGLTQLSGDTGSTLSGITAGPSDIGAREKREAKKERKRLEKERREREKEKKKDRKSRNARKVGEDGALVDEMAEAEAKDAMRQYRHERPARVGGLNKESEGSQWDGSTNPSESNVGSSLLSDRQSTPEKKSAGIRKVYSVADRNAAREQERIRAEARRLQEKGRAASRPGRDFSFRRGDSIVEESVGRSSRSEITSSSYLIAEEEESDLGTKSYHHVIPGLSSSQGGTDIVDYADERRKRRGAGYRRER